MLERIHRKLGTAGFIISIVALVAALGGGAYAASGGLTGKQKKEVEKIAKKYAGKPGAQGAAGPAGPAGGKGDAGAKGDAGTAGSNGSSGSDGTNGTNGTNGSPWTAGGTLPTGSTETGAYLWGPVPENGTIGRATISFPIPLAEGVTVAVHFVALEEDEGEKVPAEPTVECPGTIEEPAAAAGNLCIYEAKLSGEVTGTVTVFNPEIGNALSGPGSTGGVVNFGGVEEAAIGRGVWAVTAP